MTDTSAVRRALIELHRVLLNAQRIQAERFGGRMSSSELLQAAADDLRSSWLKEPSCVIVALDQAHAGQDSAGARAAIARARALLDPPDADTALGARYLRALQDDPDVVFADRGVTAAFEV